MKLLANYCRGRDCAIRVGVVGERIVFSYLFLCKTKACSLFVVLKEM